MTAIHGDGIKLTMRELQVLRLDGLGAEPGQVGGVGKERGAAACGQGDFGEVFAEQIFVADQGPQALAGHAPGLLVLTAVLVVHRNAERVHEPSEAGRDDLACGAVFFGTTRRGWRVSRD